MATLYPMKRAVLELVINETQDKFIIPFKGAYPNKITDNDTELRFTIHISIQDLEGITSRRDPPKTVTNEEAILQGVNTSIWLPIMTWRDYLTEIGAKDDVIWGLTWLIDHKRFPEEGFYESDDYKGIAYRWLIEGDEYAAHRLPSIISYEIQRTIIERGKTQLVPRVFKTIHQAFWAAAETIGKNRDRMPIAKPTTQPAEEDETNNFGYGGGG